MLLACSLVSLFPSLSCDYQTNTPTNSPRLSAAFFFSFSPLNCRMIDAVDPRSSSQKTAKQILLAIFMSFDKSNDDGQSDGQISFPSSQRA